MGRKRKNDDGMYYGDLPSRYLADLGKKIVAERVKDGKSIPDIGDNYKSK